jgi:probable rRNA maturation factor
MNQVEFINAQRKIGISKEVKDILVQCIDKAAQNEGIKFPIGVDITFLSDKNIQKVNREYRGVNQATDVLSFPIVDFLDGEPQEDLETLLDEKRSLLLGDIIISVERAQIQAEEYGHSFLREMGFLCVHSMLHLLGYAHEEDETRTRMMRDKEETVLASLGLLR